jgi:hypothetical protein
MYNSVPYYFLLFGHLISLVVGFGAVIVIDAFGLLWLIKWWGVDLTLVRRVANITQRLIWVGFTGLVLTGIPMLLMKGTVSDMTIIKLALVAMVGLNGVFLHYIKKMLDALGQDITDVPAKVYFRISLASAISQIGWWGATAIGFLNRQVGYKPAWASNYLLIIGLLVFALGLAALVGEYRTSRRRE